MAYFFFLQIPILHRRAAQLCLSTFHFLTDIFLFTLSTPFTHHSAHHPPLITVLLSSYHPSLLSFPSIYHYLQPFPRPHLPLTFPVSSSPHVSPFSLPSLLHAASSFLPPPSRFITPCSILLPHHPLLTSHLNNLHSSPLFLPSTSTPPLLISLSIRIWGCEFSLRFDALFLDFVYLFFAPFCFFGLLLTSFDCVSL